MHPSLNNSGVLIDGRTQEVINPQTGKYFPQQPPIPPAYRKGKSGEQTDILINHFWYARQSLGDMQLRISDFGTKYLYCNTEFVFFESDTFDDRLRTFAYNIGISDITDTTIKSIKSIVRADPRFWVRDTNNCQNGSVRILHHGSTPYYSLDSNHFICLNLYHYQLNPNIPHNPVAFLYSPKSKTANLFNHTTIYDFEYINSLQHRNINLKSTYHLLNLIGIPTQQQSLIVTWLIHVYLAKEPIVLQIIEDQGILGPDFANLLKHLIDPSAEESFPIPKKASEIVEYGFDHYVLHFSVSSGQKLSKEQQETLFTLTTNKGAKHNITNSRNKEAEYHVKRAVIISTQSNAINLPLLHSRTLTLDLNSTENFNLACFDASQIRSQLLESAIHIATFANSYNTKLSIETSSPSFIEYLTIGQHIENLVNRGSGNFITEFSQHMELDIFSQFNNDEDEELAFLLLQWAKENCGSTKTQSIGHWQTTLERVAADNNSSIDEISPRKIGATFKKLKPILKKLGIRLEPVKNSSRFCEWTVAVQDTVGLINKAEEVPLSPV